MNREEFLKLKPGDKLRVNENLKKIDEKLKNGIPYGYVSEMDEYEGRIVTVKHTFGFDEYRANGPLVELEEDRHCLSWAPQCFKGKVKISSDKKPKEEPQKEAINSCTYKFSLDKNNKKVICKRLSTGYETFARCHEEDTFSLDVGQLVAFAHMLGYDVEHNGSNERFTLVKKNPQYRYGNRVVINTRHPDCTKLLKEYNFKIGLILSSVLDRSTNRFIYKVVFENGQIIEAPESVLEFAPLIIEGELGVDTSSTLMCHN